MGARYQSQRSWRRRALLTATRRFRSWWSTTLSSRAVRFGPGRRESRKEVAEIAEGLKAIAKDLLVPVVALAQLNRDVERREDKKPMLSDLRESGQLEQAADAVLMLYREGYYNKDADQHSTDVLIRKHRHGRSCDFKLRWTPEMVRFDSLMPEDR